MVFTASLKGYPLCPVGTLPSPTLEMMRALSSCSVRLFSWNVRDLHTSSLPTVLLSFSPFWGRGVRQSTSFLLSLRAWAPDISGSVLVPRKCHGLVGLPRRWRVWKVALRGSATMRPAPARCALHSTCSPWRARDSRLATPRRALTFRPEDQVP